MTHLYLIEAVGTPYVKIGRAGNPDGRLVDLQSACPIELRIRAREWGSRHHAAVERQLHEIFAPYRHHGEWFRFESGSPDRKSFERFVRTLRREHEREEAWHRVNAKPRRAIHAPLHSERTSDPKNPRKTYGWAA